MSNPTGKINTPSTEFRVVCGWLTSSEKEEKPPPPTPPLGLSPESASG